MDWKLQTGFGISVLRLYVLQKNVLGFLCRDFMLLVSQHRDFLFPSFNVTFNWSWNLDVLVLYGSTASFSLERLMQNFHIPIYPNLFDSLLRNVCINILCCINDDHNQTKTIWRYDGKFLEDVINMLKNVRKKVRTSTEHKWHSNSILMILYQQ